MSAPEAVWPASGAVPDAASAAPALAGERWALEDRREFLRRSLDDADREHEAGDLGDDDHRLLRRRDEALLAEVEARLDELAAREAAGPPAGAGEADGAAAAGTVDVAGGAGGARDAAGGASGRGGTAATGDTPGDAAPRATGRRRLPRRPRRPRRRAWLAVGGTLAVVAGAVVLVVSLTTARLPGQVATGGLTLSEQQQVKQELDQAAVLVDDHQGSQALQLYQAVLAKVPDQPTALAEAGWLEWQSGTQSGSTSLEAAGRRLVARAVAVTPGFYAGRLYLGTIDYDHGDPAAAVAQYRKFLADHPPSGWVKDYAPEIRDAFTAAGQPVPAGVPSS